MFENCSAGANSKLISGPLSICMKQAHLKPPQENDLIIFNYLEWAQGLGSSRYPGLLLLLGIIVDSGKGKDGKRFWDRIHSANIILGSDYFIPEYVNEIR